jgi:hypothetical protein
MPSDTAPPPSAPAPLPHIYVLNADPSFITLMGDLLQQKGVHVTLEQLQPHVDTTLAHLCVPRRPTWSCSTPHPRAPRPPNVWPA